MKHYVVTHWYEFAVYVAGIAVLVLGLGSHHWNDEQVGLLMGFVLIQLHFFEEFGLPGGFAWGGIKVERKTVPEDVSSWPLNQASAFFGNEWFAVAVYLLPLLVPAWRWAVLASFLFAYAEFAMHYLVFNIGLRRFYNPGVFTAGCLTLVSTQYLAQHHTFARHDWLIAAAWCALNYMIAFRSPITRALNARTHYAFTRTDVMKAQRYMTKFPGSAEHLHNFGHN